MTESQHYYVKIDKFLLGILVEKYAFPIHRGEPR